MIRALRVRHRWMWVAITGSVAVGAVAALSGRREEPLLDTPLAVVAVPRAGLDVRLIQIDAEQVGHIELGLDEERRPSVRVVVRDVSGLVGADMLAYWVPRAAVHDAVPDDAILLGALPDGHEGTFVLPDAARAGAGRVLVWSLAHARRVFELPVEAYEVVPDEGPGRTQDDARGANR